MHQVFINALSAKVGGGKTYISNLLSNIIDPQCKIYIVCPDPSIIPDDARIKYIKTNFANKNIFFRMIWEFLYLPFLLLFTKAKVLFVPGGMDFTCFTFGIPKVTMFRNMLPFDSKAQLSLPNFKLKFKNHILKMLMLRTMKSANSVIFISYYAKNVVEGIMRITTSQVIPHGISNHFKPDKDYDKEVNENRSKYILYVSRFEPYKNHLNLIKAYASLSDTLKQIYRLILVGEFMEPAYSQCIRYVQEHNLVEHIVFKGKVEYEELPTVYKNASLFIFPSSCENCPNILLEAIGCGVPVLSSNSDPMPEFAKDAALYFDENNYHDISRKINLCLTDPMLMNEMRGKSIFLRRDYMWETTALKTWKYLELIGEKNV